MTPVQFGLRRSAVNIKDSFRLFYNLDEIRQENIGLLSQNNDLKSLIIDLKIIREENETLRNQLQVKETQPFFGKKLLMASVMGNAQDFTNTSVILDKGFSDGVKVGSNVIVGSFLIGRVISATAKISEVELITSPNFSATAKDLETGTEGIATGNLGTSIYVSKILAGENVETSDTFVTTGKDGYYLPGLGLGKVIHISQESAQPVKNALLEPGVTINSMSKVFIVLDKEE